jgi:peptide/nickel transport system ATP-binding protein
MYAGRIVESTNRDRLFAEPRHPYTGGLLESIPRLDSPRGTPLRPIPGSPTQVLPWPEGCAFAPRCRNRIDQCTSETPALEPSGGRLLRCFNPLSGADVDAARTVAP